MILARGSTGKLVKEIQRKLNAYFFDMPGMELTVDGIFGPKTEQRVRIYQQNNGLLVDGIVGPQTFASLGINIDGSAGVTTTPDPDYVTTTPQTNRNAMKSLLKLGAIVGGAILGYNYFTKSSSTPKRKTTTRKKSTSATRKRKPTSRKRKAAPAKKKVATRKRATGKRKPKLTVSRPAPDTVIVRKNQNPK